MVPTRFVTRRLICLLLCVCCFVLIKYFHQIYSIQDYDDGQGWKLPTERLSEYRFEQHGDYFILHNVNAASRRFIGNDSITLATQGTYLDLYHLENIVMRWEGPMSITLFANGVDFEKTIQAINYMFQCTDSGILFKELVSIHLCMHHQHLPAQMTSVKNTIFNSSYDCNTNPELLLNEKLEKTYWYQHNLSYPYGLLRNIARMHARTYYVMSMDFGWYPLKDFVPRFLKMIEKEHLPMAEASIFCFPHLRATEALLEVPETESDALYALHAHITEADIDEDAERTLQIYDKLLGNMRIESISSNNGMCKSEFISINSKLPFFDERLCKDTLMLNLLRLLNYDFVSISGTALIKHPRALSYATTDIVQNMPHGKASNTTNEILRRVTLLWLQLHHN